jgi:hypothetical protein
VGLGGVNPNGHQHYVLIHHAQKLNALLPLRMSLQKQPIQILYYLTASNDIQQHVNSGDVDIRNLTITLILTVVLQRSWYQMKNEQKYPWLYDSVVHQGYLSKFCELFCGHSSSSQEFVTVGINLGTV